MKNNEEQVEIVKFDLDKVKSNLPSYSTEKICEMIVCDRYFGFEEKVSSICMEELAKRRLAGDDFDFENYIDSAYKTLPELNFNTDIRSLLQNVIAGRNKK